MRLLCVALAVLMSGCFFFRGSIGKGNKQSEQKRAKKMRHAEKQAYQDWQRQRPAKLRTISLDVYADAKLVSNVRTWKARFRNLIKHANEVVGPLLDVRFEVLRFNTYSPKADPNDKAALLDELYKLTPGKQMVFVVALLHSKPSIASNFDELGAAILGGRHMFLRNLDDLDEHRSLAERHKADKRDRLYLERKRHRELVVFLHEVGHLLGLEHHDKRDAIMFHGYRRQQRRFLPASAARMRGAIVAELAGSREDLAERRKADALDEARRRASAAISKATATSDPEEASLHLQEAEAVLAPHGDKVPQLWARVAEAYRGQLLVTLAEQALARAGAQGSSDVGRWITKTRARYAIPANAASLGLTPANEPEYIQSYNGIVSAIASDETAKARRLTRAAVRRHGKLPGFDVLLCDVEMRDGKHARAATLCKKALAGCETSSWVHFLSGHLALRKKDRATARRHFARAAELDPELLPARRALADLDSQ